MKNEETTIRITVKKNSDTGEYVCRVFVNGKYSEEASYYTDDKKDAMDTRKAMLETYAKQGFTVTE